MNELLEQAGDLITKDPQKSLNLFNQILSHKKDDIRALCGIAELLLNDRQNQQAMKFALKAINANAPLSVKILDAKSKSYGILAIANERERRLDDAGLYLSAHQLLADLCANPQKHILDQNPHFQADSFSAYSQNPNHAPQFLEHGVLSYENDKDPFYALACVLVAFYHANIKACKIDENKDTKNSANFKISKSYELPQNPSPQLKEFYANAMIFLALLAFDMDNKAKAQAFLDEAGHFECAKLYEAMKYRILCAIMLGKNDIQKARELAQKALIYPNFKNHLVLANIAIYEKDFVQAKDELQKAYNLAKTPGQNAEILSFEAYLSLKENDAIKAKELAKKALEINKKLKIAIIVLLNLENQNIKKLDIMALLLNIHPYQKNVYNEIITKITALSVNIINASDEQKMQQKTSANEMFKSSKFSLGLDAALSLLDFYPDDAKNTMVLANAFASNADLNTAIKFYSRAAMIDDVKTHALKKLSSLYYAQKDYIRAFNALELLVKDGKADEDVAIYKTQAEIAIETGVQKLLELSTKLIDKIKEVEPNSQHIDILNAKIFEKKGKYFDAIKELEKVLEKHPDNEEVLGLLSQCYNNINEYEKWESCYTKVLNLHRQKIINDLKIVTQKDEIDVNDRQFLLLENADLISGMLWTCHYIHGKDEKEIFKLAKRYGDIVAAKTRFVYEDYECKKFGVDEFLSSELKSLNLNSAKAWDFSQLDKLPPVMAEPSSCEALRAYLKKHNKKLRIGMTSGDLKNHPVGYVLEGAFKLLDKEIFELYAFVTHGIEDDLSARIKPHFTSWQSIAGISPAAAAAKIHECGINILLDLSGHTGYNALLAHDFKPSPVSATYIGCPFSTGLHSIDYIVGDPILMPASEHEAVSERIFNLPKNWWHFTMPPDIDTNELLSINQDAPYKRNGYFTFGSFNNIYKMNDTVVALWAKILLAVPNSKLFLNYKQLTDESQKERIREWFGRYGVSGDRFILDFTTPRYKTLNTYNLIDLCLDPFPFCGFTTTAEALMMGVPVIALKGNSLLTRAANSILTNTNLSEFVASDLDEYFAKAVHFATSGRDHLAHLRANAKDCIKNQALFDTPRFSKDLENMFLQMWINYELGVKLR